MDGDLLKHNDLFSPGDLCTEHGGEVVVDGLQDGPGGSGAISRAHLLGGAAAQGNVPRGLPQKCRSGEGSK